MATENWKDTNELKDAYAEIAHRLVDAAIATASRAIRLSAAGTPDSLPVAFRNAAHVSATELNEKDENSTSAKENDTIVVTTIPNIVWPTIEEFTPELGSEKIMEFIRTWRKDECWLYYITLINTDRREYDIRYRYKVRWSIPTRCHPIPRATASVYFTIELSTIKPPTFPVEVYYVFETNRLVHRPGHSRFQEKWLKDILISKISLADQIDF